MSSPAPSATRAKSSPVAGLCVSKVFPDAASTHLPPISSFFDGVAELDGLAPDGGASLQTLNVILGEAQGGDLIEAFLYIRSGIVRRKIVDLVREISISQA